MSPGDTCTVYAGTYNENVTVPAGTAGNYKTITVNGSDVVTVLGFTLNSHTKLIGNCTAPGSHQAPADSTFRTTSSPSSACVRIGEQRFNRCLYHEQRHVRSCGCGGSADDLDWQASTGVSYVYIQGNTMSLPWLRDPGRHLPTTATAIGINGNHVLVENNDLSHLRSWRYRSMARSTGLFATTRSTTSIVETWPDAGTATLIFVYAEPATGFAIPVQYQFVRETTSTTPLRAQTRKGLWTAADNPCGCAAQVASMSSATTCSLILARSQLRQTSGFLNVKFYNNSIVDADTECCRCSCDG